VLKYLLADLKELTTKHSTRL